MQTFAIDDVIMAREYCLSSSSNNVMSVCYIEILPCYGCRLVLGSDSSTLKIHAPYLHQNQSFVPCLIESHSYKLGPSPSITFFEWSYKQTNKVTVTGGNINLFHRWKHKPLSPVET